MRVSRFLGIGLGMYFALFSWNVVARNYYVSSSAGSDTASGDINHPWRTIQHATKVLRAGDTVFIRKGTYYGPIFIRRSGSASGGYIVYRNYPNETPIITSNTPNCKGGVNPLCRTPTLSGQGVSYIKIIGLHFYRANAENITFGGPGSHIEIRNNTVSEQNAQVLDLPPPHHRLGHAISIRTKKNAPMSHIIIDGNHVHHNHTGHVKAYDEALTVLGTVSYFQVTNNIVHDNDFIGLDVIGHYKGPFGSFGMCRYGIVAGNKSYRNSRKAPWLWSAGLYLDGGEYVIVERNEVHDNQAPGISVNQEAPADRVGPVIVRFNRIWSNGKYSFSIGASTTSTLYDSVFVHNTTYGSRQNTEVYLFNGKNIAVKNNIFFKLANTAFIIDMKGRLTDSTWILDHNAYAPASPTSIRLGRYRGLNSYRASTGKGKHSIAISNPGLTDPAKGNFALKASSPCIDKGGFLTKTKSSGSGTRIAVLDARYFTDGWGVTKGDLVVVGRNKPVRVTAVDRRANVLTVASPISWNAGDPVSYPYTGKAPDIGAVEYNSGSSQTGPVADAGPDLFAVDNDADGKEIVTLNGSRSYHKNGKIASYIWREGTKILASQMVAKVAFSVGVHTVTLEVKDTQGLTDTDSLIVTVSPKQGQKKLYEVLHTLTPPIIDGDLSEFSKVSPLIITNSRSGAVGKYYLLWDNTALYIAASVKDIDLSAHLTARDGALWNDDSVELFFDTLMNRGSRLMPDDYKFFINLQNAHRDSKGGAATWSITYFSQVRLRGTLNVSGDVDRGYTIECRIPWGAWGLTPPRAGTRWGFDVAMNDLKAGKRYQESWAHDSSKLPNVPNNWGKLVFSSKTHSIERPLPEPRRERVLPEPIQEPSWRDEPSAFDAGGREAQPRPELKVPDPQISPDRKVPDPSTSPEKMTSESSWPSERSSEETSSFEWPSSFDGPNDWLDVDSAKERPFPYRVAGCGCHTQRSFPSFFLLLLFFLFFFWGAKRRSRP